jgi:hypothetical protein
LLETVRDERLFVRPVFAGRTCDADVDAIGEVAAVVGWEVEATLFLAASPIRVWVEGWSLPELAERAARAIAAAGLPAHLPALGLTSNGAALVDHMRHDKKAEGATLPFLLLRGIGAAYVARDVDLADIAAFLDAELAA